MRHNHFNQYGINASEAWGRPRDDKLFPGWDGFVNYSLGLYYRYLNLGFRLPPSAGTASGVLPNPVGYNRMYVKVPGAFSLDAWYSTLRNGEVMVTNGPMLFFTTQRDGKTMEASVEVIAREPIDRVELVANGSVIHTFPVQANASRYNGKVSFDPTRYSWVAARSFLKRGPTVRLAQTAAYFVEWIDELIAETTKDVTRFASGAERDEVLNHYRKARAYFAAKQK